MSVPMQPLWVPSGGVRGCIGAGTYPVSFVPHYEANPNSGLLLAGTVKCQQTEKVPQGGAWILSF